ncbi:unnamed protein product [Penicillium camemberti]|uniref:Str. FM013 n=1 Tax=Penicillium camemberti (strain FM 013) TaxID=1429867 RepID=A0A0G4NY84_PENC3|nr:unnamed protein product [Penicillium camemberti]
MNGTRDTRYRLFFNPSIATPIGPAIPSGGSIVQI